MLAKYRWRRIIKFANRPGIISLNFMLKCAAIINAGSGTQSDTDQLKERVSAAFESNGIEAKIILVESGAELIKSAQNCAQSEFEIIVAGGGDGTISAVAAAIVGTNKTLGVLPLGTLNHFSKDLGIPQDLDEAVRVITENNIKEVDVGEVNEQIFLNNSSLGLYPSIVRRRERQQRLGQSKWYAAFWATVAVLRRYPFFAIKLKTENEELTRRTPFIFIGNNEYEMEVFNIGTRKCLDAGKLSVYLLRRTGRTGLVKLALRSIFGLLRQAKDFESFCTAEVLIETRRPKKMLVAFDGEVRLMETPLNYRVREKSLRVIVPSVKSISDTET